MDDYDKFMIVLYSMFFIYYINLLSKNRFEKVEKHFDILDVD